MNRMEHFLVAIASLYSVASQPNFFVIIVDDVGYGDFQVYGHPSQEQSPIDAMAREGMKFMNWYSGGGSESATRASLLTGRLPSRNGVYGSSLEFQASDSGGLPKEEITIAEALRDVGYATGMAGKWHLGINEQTSDDGGHLPYHHGFQEVGTVYPLGQQWQCNSEKVCYLNYDICRFLSCSIKKACRQ